MSHEKKILDDLYNRLDELQKCPMHITGKHKDEMERYKNKARCIIFIPDHKLSPYYNECNELIRDTLRLIDEIEYDIIQWILGPYKDK